MKVLVACEFSGIVREAFTRQGHDAYSCDLLPSEIPGKHIQDDVLRVIGRGWDLMIAHPPCTYLCLSGVRWLHNEPRTGFNPDRWAALETACGFFRKLLFAPIPRIAIENPTPHAYAVSLIGSTYSQTIHPWQFGHGEKKRTQLWLKGLPKLNPTRVVAGRVPRVHFTPQGPNRWKIRSRTYTGIAAAMAKQWG